MCEPSDLLISANGNLDIDLSVFGYFHRRGYQQCKLALLEESTSPIVRNLREALKHNKQVELDDQTCGKTVEDIMNIYYNVDARKVSADSVLADAHRQALTVTHFLSFLSDRVAVSPAQIMHRGTPRGLKHMLVDMGPGPVRNTNSYAPNMPNCVVEDHPAKKSRRKKQPKKGAVGAKMLCDDVIQRLVQQPSLPMAEKLASQIKLSGDQSGKNVDYDQIINQLLLDGPSISNGFLNQEDSLDIFPTGNNRIDQRQSHDNNEILALVNRNPCSTPVVIIDEDDILVEVQNPIENLDTKSDLHVQNKTLEMSKDNDVIEKPDLRVQNETSKKTKDNDVIETPYLRVQNETSEKTKDNDVIGKPDLDVQNEPSEKTKEDDVIEDCDVSVCDIFSETCDDSEMSHPPVVPQRKRKAQTSRGDSPRKKGTRKNVVAEDILKEIDVIRSPNKNVAFSSPAHVLSPAHNFDSPISSGNETDRCSVSRLIIAEETEKLQIKLPVKKRVVDSKLTQEPVETKLPEVPEVAEEKRKTRSQNKKTPFCSPPLNNQKNISPMKKSKSCPRKSKSEPCHGLSAPKTRSTSRTPNKRVNGGNNESNRSKSISPKKYARPTARAETHIEHNFVMEQYFPQVMRRVKNMGPKKQCDYVNSVARNRIPKEIDDYCRIAPESTFYDPDITDLDSNHGDTLDIEIADILFELTEPDRAVAGLQNDESTTNVVNALCNIRNSITPPPSTSNQSFASSVQSQPRRICVSQLVSVPLSPISKLLKAQLSRNSSADVTPIRGNETIQLRSNKIMQQDSTLEDGEIVDDSMSDSSGNSMSSHSLFSDFSDETDDNSQGDTNSVSDNMGKDTELFATYGGGGQRPASPLRVTEHIQPPSLVTIVLDTSYAKHCNSVVTEHNNSSPQVILNVSNPNTESADEGEESEDFDKLDKSCQKHFEFGLRLEDASPDENVHSPKAKIVQLEKVVLPIPNKSERLKYLRQLHSHP